MQDVRQLVLDRLRELGWTKYELAVRCDRLGARKTSIYAWLAGHRDIMLRTYLIVCRVLEIEHVARRDRKA